MNSLPNEQHDAEQRRTQAEQAAALMGLPGDPAAIAFAERLQRLNVELGGLRLTVAVVGALLLEAWPDKFAGLPDHERARFVELVNMARAASPEVFRARLAELSAAYDIATGKGEGEA